MSQSSIKPRHENEPMRGSRLSASSFRARKHGYASPAEGVDDLKLVDEAQVLLESLPEDDRGVVARNRVHQVLHLDAVKLSNL